jgi:hypothetical protein
MTARLPLLPFAIAAALALMLVMNLTGAPLINATAPLGIVSFELARTPQASAAILASWDASAQRFAAFGLGLDYLFMLAYAGALALACLKAAAVLQRCRWPLSGWGRYAAWGVAAAALLDAIENVALSVILLGQQPLAPWPQLAAVCAALKFALLFLALVYVFYALAAALASRLAP